MVKRYALPLTFVYVYDDEEPAAWCVIACKIDVVTQGETLDEARWMIQDAAGLWTTVEIEEGRGDDLSRPVPREDLAEFIGSAPPERRVVEMYVLLLTVETEPQPKVTALEFIRSSFQPACSLLPVAA